MLYKLPTLYPNFSIKKSRKKMKSFKWLSVGIFQPFLRNFSVYDSWEILIDKVIYLLLSKYLAIYTINYVSCLSKFFHFTANQMRRQSTTEEILIARGFRRESTTEDIMRCRNVRSGQVSKLHCKLWEINSWKVLTWKKVDSC